MQEFEFLQHQEDNPQKTDTKHTVLLAEPLFKNPKPRQDHDIYMLPKGCEQWAYTFKHSLKSKPEETQLLEEYAFIADALKRNDVPFRMIIAHRKLLDERLVLAFMAQFRARGLSLDASISSVGFPRDMMVDIGNIHFLNPDANFVFPDGKGIRSPLGEGGAVMQLNEKLFLADTRSYPKSKKTSYEQSIKRVSSKYKIGFLPHPIGIRLNTKTNKTEEFFSNHPDRVAAAIHGKDGKDYLLVEKDYFDENKLPWGNYWQAIRAACKKTETELVVVNRNTNNIPYSLNLEQFKDGSVVMTVGDSEVRKIVKQIVGEEKVVTTQKPILAYPLLRHGGIRCMILIAPKKIVGKPVIQLQ